MILLNSGKELLLVLGNVDEARALILLGGDTAKRIDLVCARILVRSLLPFLGSGDGLLTAFAHHPKEDRRADANHSGSTGKDLNAMIRSSQRRAGTMGSKGYPVCRLLLLQGHFGPVTCLKLLEVLGDRSLVLRGHCLPAQFQVDERDFRNGGGGRGGRSS